MRLIDAMAYRKVLKEEQDYQLEHYKNSLHCRMGLEIAIADLGDAPTIDAVPVVHGRWKEADDGDGVVCSICGEDFCNIYLEVERFRYCPNCGAQMGDTGGE